MSDALWSQLIASMPGTLMSLGTLVVALRGLRKTQEVYHATNSMKDALVTAEKKVSFTEGQQDQKHNPQ